MMTRADLLVSFLNVNQWLVGLKFRVYMNTMVNSVFGVEFVLLK